MTEPSQYSKYEHADRLRERATLAGGLDDERRQAYATAAAAEATLAVVDELRALRAAVEAVTRAIASDAE